MLHNQSNHAITMALFEVYNEYKHLKTKNNISAQLECLDRLLNLVGALSKRELEQ